MLMTVDSPERKGRRRRMLIIAVIVVLLSRCLIFLYNISLLTSKLSRLIRIDNILIIEGLLFFTKKKKESYIIDKKKRPRFSFLICPIIIRHGVLSKDYNTRNECILELISNEGFFSHSLFLSYCIIQGDC